MSASDVAVEGRLAAEALMDDTCTIAAPATQGAYNGTTKRNAVVPGAQRYTGACRVKPAAGNQDRVVDAGEGPISLWPFVVSVPMSVTGIAVNDIVTITNVGLHSDPDLLNLHLRVRQVAKGTHLTARRLGCEVQTG